MPIQTVAISNTFNEFRQTTNLVIDEVNKLGNGTANLVINTITANTISSSSANLSISGNLVVDTITANTISSSSANLSISGNLVVDTITANTYVGVSSNLTVAGDTGSDVVSLASETLNIVGANGITTSVASNTVSVNLGSSLSVNDLTLTGGTANTLVYLNPSKQLTTLSTLSFSGTNVGINNASPAAPLDVKGAIRLTGASTGYVGLQAASSGTNQTYTLPASDGLNGQVLQTNGVGSLSWVNQASGGGGGGGGSGTSTARTLFTATGGQTTFSVTYTVGQLDVYMNGSKLVANNDFTAADGTSIVLAAGATAGDIVEAVSYSSQWITSGTSLYYANGSVGVGTTSPASRLHVASANTAFAVGTIRLDGADSAGTVNAPVTINAVTQGGAGNGGSQLYFETRPENGSLAERMRLDSSGNLGVGTSSPASLGSNITTLDVRGSTGGGVRFGVTGAENGGLYGRSTDVILASQSNVPLLLFTNNTERARISNTGNFGIGTTSPPKLLSVNGEADVAAGSGYFRVKSGIADSHGIAFNYNNLGTGVGLITNTLGSGGLAFGGSNTTEHMRLDASGTFRVRGAGTAGSTDAVQFYGTAPASSMVLDGNGYLGIGTTTPAYRLDVRVAGLAAQFVATNGNSNQIGLSNAANAAFGFFMGSPSQGALQFSDHNGTERARINASGNLLVGTTSDPGGYNSKLVVEQVGSNTALMLNSSTGSTNTALVFRNSAVTGNAIISNVTGGVLQFNSDGNVIWNRPASGELMRLDSSGNLGIGTTPSYKLHVNGGAYASSFQVPSTTGYFYDSTGQNGLYIYGSTNGSTPNILSFNTAGTERARVSANGNISIGTTSSYDRVTIQGGLSGASGGLYVLGTTSDANWGGGISLANYTGTVYGSVNGSTGGLLLNGGTNLGIVFSANGTQQMWLSSAGRLGVGTNSPAAKLDVSGSQAGNIVAVSALDIDCSTGNYFTKTIAADSTFTFSNPPASRAYGFTLELTHTSGTVTWPGTVRWPANTAPTLTNGKTHLFVFVTDDTGSRWRGSSLVNYDN